MCVSMSKCQNQDILNKTFLQIKLSAPCVIGICIVSILLGVFYCMGGSSSRSMSPPFIVNATAKHTATVIFLHGLGDTGQGWCEGFKMIKQPHIKYVCPNAPAKPVTLNGGMRMPSWFDIYGLSPDAKQDEAGINEASDILQSLISDEERNGIPRNRIVVGGFSQGGAVALYSAFSKEKGSLAGILALSTWLPLHSAFPGAVKANQDTPILQCHGEADPLVNMAFGQMTGMLIKTFNKNHEFKGYPGLGHSSCEQEMQDCKKFLEQKLPPV